jgi:hypothetical protein
MDVSVQKLVNVKRSTGEIKHYIHNKFKGDYIYEMVIQRNCNCTNLAIYSVTAWISSEYFDRYKEFIK